MWEKLEIMREKLFGSKKSAGGDVQQALLPEGVSYVAFDDARQLEEGRRGEPAVSFVDRMKAITGDEPVRLSDESKEFLISVVEDPEYGYDVRKGQGAFFTHDARRPVSVLGTALGYAVGAGSLAQGIVLAASGSKNDEQVAEANASEGMVTAVSVAVGVAAGTYAIGQALLGKSMAQRDQHKAGQKIAALKEKIGEDTAVWDDELKGLMRNALVAYYRSQDSGRDGLGAKIGGMFFGGIALKDGVSFSASAGTGSGLGAIADLSGTKSVDAATRAEITLREIIKKDSEEQQRERSTSISRGSDGPQR